MKRGASGLRIPGCALNRTLIVVDRGTSCPRLAAGYVQASCLLSPVRYRLRWPELSHNTRCLARDAESGAPTSETFQSGPRRRTMWPERGVDRPALLSYPFRARLSGVYVEGGPSSAEVPVTKAWPPAGPCGLGQVPEAVVLCRVNFVLTRVGVLVSQEPPSRTENRGANEETCQGSERRTELARQTRRTLVPCARPTTRRGG